MFPVHEKGSGHYSASQFCRRIWLVPKLYPVPSYWWCVSVVTHNLFVANISVLLRTRGETEMSKNRDSETRTMKWRIQSQRSRCFTTIKDERNSLLRPFTNSMSRTVKCLWVFTTGMSKQHRSDNKSNEGKIERINCIPDFWYQPRRASFSSLKFSSYLCKLYVRTRGFPSFGSVFLRGEKVFPKLCFGKPSSTLTIVQGNTRSNPCSYFVRSSKEFHMSPWDLSFGLLRVLRGPPFRKRK